MNWFFDQWYYGHPKLKIDYNMMTLAAKQQDGGAKHKRAARSSPPTAAGMKTATRKDMMCTE
jgi:hypothetical protein